MIFHRKRQHKQGPCTVNFPQHCTFVSGVSQTCDWDRFKLNLISFVQGNRSPEKSHMIWAGLSTNAAEWVLNVLICYHCYLNTKNGNAHWHKEILTFITCMTNSFYHKYLFLALSHSSCPRVLGSSWMGVVHTSQIVPSSKRLWCYVLLTETRVNWFRTILYVKCAAVCPQFTVYLSNQVSVLYYIVMSICFSF